MSDRPTTQVEILPPEDDMQGAIERAQDERILLHVCYGLLVGGFFSAGLTTLIALVLAYIKRHPEEGFSYSHLTWVIRSAWIAFIGFLVSGLFILTIFFSFIGFALAAVMLVWNVIRIAKGWLLLLDKRPIDNPHNLI